MIQLVVHQPFPLPNGTTYNRGDIVRPEDLAVVMEHERYLRRCVRASIPADAPSTWGE